MRLSFESVFHFIKKPWVIFVYAVLVVFVFCFADKPIAIYFHQLDLRVKIHFLFYLTALGQSMLYVALLLCLGFYARHVSKNRVYESKIWYLLGCLIAANLVCFVLKVTLSRARPDIFFADNAFGFYWFKSNSDYWSFPSGHTTTVIGLAAGLGVLFSRYFPLFLISALFVAASRVLLYFHYLSDVMSAFYISLLTVGFFTEYLKTRVVNQKHFVF